MTKIPNQPELFELWDMSELCTQAKSISVVYVSKVNDVIELLEL